MFLSLYSTGLYLLHQLHVSLNFVHWGLIISTSSIPGSPLWRVDADVSGERGHSCCHWAHRKALSPGDRLNDQRGTGSTTAPATHILFCLALDNGISLYCLSIAVFQGQCWRLFSFFFFFFNWIWSKRKLNDGKTECKVKRHELKKLSRFNIKTLLVPLYIFSAEISIEYN